MSRILVVDDEFDVSQTLAAVLEAQGYQVDIRENGNEALDYLKEKRPDLLLLDLMMPFRSGLEVLREMRGSDKMRTIPVVLMCVVQPTALHRELGYSAVLRKPFSIDTLLRAVESNVRARMVESRL